METFDIVVIGAGPGGYPAAIRAAQLGASVAIVEKEQLGGTCLNWGCIPTKALIAAADTFAKIKHAEAFGITVKDASVDYAVMIGHKNKVVGQLQGGIKQLLTANGVKQFAGTATFKDRNTIAIENRRQRWRDPHRREEDHHRHRLHLGHARFPAETRARRGKPRLPRPQQAARNHDCPRRRLHRLRTGLHGGDARRQSHHRRTARRHSAAARSRRAPRSARAHGEEPRHPRPHRQGAGKNRRRRQGRARQFRRRSARSRPAAVRRGPQAGHRRLEAGKRRREDQRTRVHRGRRLLPHQSRHYFRHRRRDGQNPTCPLRHRAGHRRRRKRRHARSRTSTTRLCPT